jgi:hypothetical protein
MELVIELYQSGYYFPCGVIVLFSIVSPCVKLLVILYGEIVGSIFRIKFDDSSKIVDLRKGLRVIAKYQCVDVFVTIITRQLVNSDFVLCRLEPGFYYFTFYALISVIAAQLSDYVPNQSHSSSVPSHRTAATRRMSKLDAFLLLSSVSMFVVGQAWSIGLPILAVKFLFQSKIVIGETVASLSSFFESLNQENLKSITEDVLCSSLVGATVIVIPTILVGLSTLIQCCDPGRSTRAFRSLSKFALFLSDWALLDVFAVALLTSLFALASFSVLRATAPWGFYCVLMAAMSAYEVAKVVDCKDSSSSAGGYSHLSEEYGIELPRVSGDIDEKNSDDASSPRDESSEHAKRTVVVRSGFVYVIVTIIKKLGLPFFMLKALGWAVFFIVWYMNTANGSLDLNTLSNTLRSNIPLVSRALKSAIPSAIGMCSEFNKTTSTCVEKGYLHYEKNSAYEVLARWMSGFENVQITDMYVSVPAKSKLALNVRGSFSEIQLSLFIGQCIGNWFGGDKDDAKIPSCSSVFDQVHKWKDIKWGIEVEADCSTSVPYVKNIAVDEVLLESEMKIEQELGFGISLPLDDLSEEFKKGIRESIQPLLIEKKGWIPWGPHQYDLTSLLSKLVELNADSVGGTLQFTCPNNS